MSNANDIVVEAFMGHVPHSQIDYIVETLKSYEEVINYLVAMETSPTVGEHMHFIIKSVKTSSSCFYEKFRERVFKRKLALRGRALKNKPRQYGKIKDIKDYQKIGAYTVKDGNIRTNFPQDEIDLFRENSYKKFELEGYYSQFLEKIDKYVIKLKLEHVQSDKQLKKEWFDTHPTTCQNSDMDSPAQCPYSADPLDLSRTVKLYIIKELKDSDTESITKGKIDAIWNRWMSKRLSPDEIYKYIYQKRA